MSDNKDINTLSFEQALGELEMLVRKMEGGEASLEESIVFYERGMALKAYCEKKLSEAKMRVEKIVVGSDGNLSTQPFENQE